jgi:hypothetical protein
MASQKVEPMPKGVSLSKVADMGTHQIRTRPVKDPGRGYKAPMNESSTHKSGSQGKH